MSSPEVFQEGQLAAELILGRDNPVLLEIAKLDPNDRERIDMFVDQRLTTLNSSTQPQSIVVGNDTIEGYINPGSLVIELSNLFAWKPGGLILDDPSVFAPLIEAILKMSRAKTWSNKPLSSTVPFAIETQIRSYFEGEEYLGDRELLHDEFATERSRSVSEFRGKGLAVCMEYALLTHEMLTFLGFDALAVFTTYYQSENGDNGHVYNIIKREDGGTLYDSSAPVRFYDTQGNNLGFFPALAMLSPEEMANLTDYSNEVKKTLHDVILDKQTLEFSLGEEHKRVYGGAPIAFTKG